MIRVRVLRHRPVGRRAGPIRVESAGEWINLVKIDSPNRGEPSDMVFTPGQPRPGTLWKPASADDGTITLRSPVLLEQRFGRWRLVDGWGSRAEIHASSVLEISSGGPDAAVLSLQGSPYPGALRFVRRGEGGEKSIDVVNHVPLEDYLPGVLAGELYSHWHLHTHAAQAVAARSFACCEHAYYLKKRHYDVTDTQRSQVYRGAKGHERAFEAVDMTRGQVLVWDDALVPGYYSSCCGGTAARAVDAIGPNPINNIPPLHGRSGTDVCTDAPRYRWQIDRPRNVLAERIAAYGEYRGKRDLARLKNIASIEVAQRNEHGRPTHYVVTDRRGGDIEVPAETLRLAANFSDDDLPAPEKRLHSSNFTAGIIGRTATFEGQGHGHGVGLCQYGAQTLAQQGRTWDSIITWYYPAVTIARAYG